MYITAVPYFFFKCDGDASVTQPDHHGHLTFSIGTQTQSFALHQPLRPPFLPPIVRYPHLYLSTHGRNIRPEPSPEPRRGASFSRVVHMRRGGTTDADDSVVGSRSRSSAYSPFRDYARLACSPLAAAAEHAACVVSLAVNRFAVKAVEHAQVRTVARSTRGSPKFSRHTLDLTSLHYFPPLFPFRLCLCACV
jgi:hypothetical protein